MAWNRTTYQYVVFVGKNLNDFQTFHFHAVLAHTTSHTHSFEYTRRIRRTTDRTRRSLTVVLTMGSFTHTRESVALYNTLETFTFCCTHYFHFIAFSENVYSNGITNC